MSVKTVRFNKQEENTLKIVLRYYHTDFSSCVMELISEKLGDLRDIGCIKRFKEGKRANYLTSTQIDKLYHSCA